MAANTSVNKRWVGHYLQRLLCARELKAAHSGFILWWQRIPASLRWALSGCRRMSLRCHLFPAFFSLSLALLSLRLPINLSMVAPLSGSVYAWRRAFERTDGCISNGGSEPSC